MKSVAVVSMLMAMLLGLAAGLCAADDDFAAWVLTDGLPFPCVAGQECKVLISLDNTGKADLALSNWSVAVKPENSLKLEVKPDPANPSVVKPDETAMAIMAVTLPESAGGKNITLVCSVLAGGKLRSTEVEVPVTPQFEITLLPTRLILGPGDEPKPLGVSVINHTQDPFEGKVKLSAPAGLGISPAEVDMMIDPLGLEAFVLSIKPRDNPVPGHYTLWMDVGGKVKDWAMVDVPAVAKKIAVKVDGALDEWKGAQSVSVTRVADGKHVSIGKAWFASDEKNFYVAVEVEDAKHFLSTDSRSRAKADPPSDTVVIAFDPLIDGAATLKGGYKDDDVEFTLVGAENGSVVLRTAAGSRTMEQDAKLPIAFKRTGNKSVYEVAIPWTELKAFNREESSMMAVGVLVNDSDGRAVTSYVFGGGLGASVDPRLFVPVVIAE